MKARLFLFPPYLRDPSLIERLLCLVEEEQVVLDTSHLTLVHPADGADVGEMSKALTSQGMEVSTRLCHDSFLQAPGVLADGLAEMLPVDVDAAVFLLVEPGPELLLACMTLLSRIRGSELVVSSMGRTVRCRPDYAGETEAREPSAGFAPNPRVQPGASLDAICQRAGILAASEAMRSQLESALVLARHRVPVLVLGETGTGKSLVARLIHQAGDRSRQPMVSLNCAALPEKLVESILFGHRKGAFTGAVDHQDGIFLEADRSTLFLDEVGELSLEVQAKLLRVLEDGWVQPVGARKGDTVDVRILAATNRDLDREVAEGRFREDLYHRLSFGILRLPPLNQRPEDISPLACRFLQKFNASLAEPRSLGPDALRYLEAQSWPGNVRELENAVGRAALYATSPTLEIADFLDQSSSVSRNLSDTPAILGDSFSLEDYLKDAREDVIRKALDQCKGNQSAAARMLGISPQAVSKFLKAHPDS